MNGERPFVPWTIRTSGELFVSWSIRILDHLYRGPFVSWIIRIIDHPHPGLFGRWTIYIHGRLFVPSNKDRSNSATSVLHTFSTSNKKILVYLFVFTKTFIKSCLQKM